jgi:hypothetical protein
MFSFRLENESGNIVDINDGAKYIVTAASGLNPPSAALFTSKSPNRKGSKYNGSTLDERNIVITIKILGDIEANRNALYAWVDTEQYCKVYYKNGIKSVFCEGYVQDCPIELFTDNEVINLAVVCPDPYWRELQEIRADISAVIKQFTFPFAIEHKETVSYSSPNPDNSNATAKRNKGIPLSTLRATNYTTLLNTGAETGVKITIKTKSEISNITIFDARDTTRVFRINTTLQAGEIIVIDTDASPKSCKLYRVNGTIDNIMRYVGANPTWFTLKKGVNAFGFLLGSGSSGGVDISIGYTNKYLGV